MELSLKNERIGVLIRKMSLPAIIAMLVNGLYYLVDAAFVGWGVGSSALGGLAVVFPVQMFTIAWGSMIGMGAASVISRRLGEDNLPGASNAASKAVRLAAASGLFFTLIAILARHRILVGLGATFDTFLDAAEYLDTLRIGFVFVFLSMVGFNIARAQGKAKEAGRGMLLGTLINLILDPLFIFGFGWGIYGAALATVIARGISTLYFILLLGGKAAAVPMNLRTGDSEEYVSYGEILFLGLGNFLSQVACSVVAIVVNRTIRELGGTIDLAVYGVVSRIHVFITMPLIGLAHGFQPVAGYSAGKKDWQRVSFAVKISLATAMGIGTVMLVPTLFTPSFIMALFSKDPALVAAGTAPLRISMALLPVIGIQIIGFAYFQALGDPRRTLIVSLSRQFVFLIPLVLLLPRLIGFNGIWIAFPSADLMAALLSLIMIRLTRVESAEAIRLKSAV